MIKKAFSNKEEIKDFEVKYSNGELDTEVIANLLQPYYESKFPEISKYCNFWWPTDANEFRLKGVLHLMIALFGPNALKESFGKYDFSFEGNREYKNYVLEFEGLTFVAPAKREVVLPKDVNVREKLVRFENAYSQFVMDFIFKNYKKLADYEREALNDLKTAGIINEKNQIDFENEGKLNINKKIKKP